MQIINTFELRIYNDIIELRRMSDWLHNACAELALDESLAMNLDLCANEAVANIINYAYIDHDRHEIDLYIEHKINQSISLTMEDDGFPFNPFEVLPPQPFDMLENAKIGGLGIHLIRNLMHECQYRRFNNKNIITLSVSLNQKSIRPQQNAVSDI